LGAYRVKAQKWLIQTGQERAVQEQRILLDWRHGKIGPLSPCVLCGKLALCRSPIKDVPCHKGCAEAWIVAHAQDEADLARFIHAYTPK
jgi:hypothetical protein